jgi:hypothetical protein
VRPRLIGICRPELKGLLILDPLELAVGEFTLPIADHTPFLLPARGTGEARTTRAAAYVFVPSAPSSSATEFRPSPAVSPAHWIAVPDDRGAR